ncbi:Uncharacterised protein [Mycobacteroides abscessus]|nr:Uncharacterised protein [Mycobacteroides abscessus]
MPCVLVPTTERWRAERRCSGTSMTSPLAATLSGAPAGGAPSV